MIKNVTVLFVCLFFFLSLTPAFPGELEELEKKFMDMQIEYQKKFEEMKREIEELKMKQAQREKEVEEIKKAALEQEKAREEEMASVKAQLEKQGRKALQAGYDKGFYIKSEDDNFKMQIGGYFQSDTRIFEGGENDSSNNDTFDIRRARIGVKGYVFENFEYKVQAELDTSDDNLTDAYLNINYSPLIQLKAGQFKKPVDYEHNISSNSTDFVERSLVVENISGSSRDIGAMVHGKLYEKRFAYYLGLFNGAGSNTTDDNDGLTFMGKTVFLPFANTDNYYLKGLRIGGSLLIGDRDAHESSGFKLAGRNEMLNRVTVDGNRLLGAGELVWYAGPFGLKGEYLFQKEERDNIEKREMEDLISQGYYVSAMYMLTGEKRSDTVVPLNDFNPREGGWGAWEVLARYEWADRDKATSEDPVLKDENVTGNTVNALTLGLNWYLNRSVRLKLNYVFYDFDRTDSLHDPGIGNNENLFLSRFQLVF